MARREMRGIEIDDNSPSGSHDEDSENDNLLVSTYDTTPVDMDDGNQVDNDNECHQEDSEGVESSVDSNCDSPRAQLLDRIFDMSDVESRNDLGLPLVSFLSFFQPS